jgi:hypothetical protein
MSDSDKQLRKLLGPVGYALVKRYLRRVKIKIDTEARKVHITKDGVTESVNFVEIERVVNEQV